MVVVLSFCWKLFLFIAVMAVVMMITMSEDVPAARYDPMMTIFATVFVIRVSVLV